MDLLLICGVIFIIISLVCELFSYHELNLYDRSLSMPVKTYLYDKLLYLTLFFAMFFSHVFICRFIILVIALGMAIQGIIKLGCIINDNELVEAFNSTIKTQANSCNYQFVVGKIMDIEDLECIQGSIIQSSTDDHDNISQ